MIDVDKIANSKAIKHFFIVSVNELWFFVFNQFCSFLYNRLIGQLMLESLIG